MFIKSLNFFYRLLNFQCAEYGISLVQKGHLKMFNHKFYFHYLAWNRTTFIVIIEYSKNFKWG